MTDHAIPSLAVGTISGMDEAILSPLLSSVERLLSGETPTDATTTTTNSSEAIDAVEYNDVQIMAGMVITRVTGVILLLSAVCMIWRSWKRLRNGCFHGFVFGMGIHLTLLGIACTIGSAAIPRDTSNAIGNVGTILTCTIQGFVIYNSLLSALSYYVSFSIYSYVGTMNNFRKSSVTWMAKYIHAGVHVYPVVTGIYLICQQRFNNSGFGFCFIENDPIGCGGSPRASTQDVVPCQRGSESYEGKLLELVFDVACWIVLVVPTGVMLALYFKVKQNQSTILIPASAVAKQVIVYLLALYVSMLPVAFINTFVWFGWFDPTAFIVLHLTSQITIMVFGVFSMLVYLYFSTGGPESGDTHDGIDEEDDSKCQIPDGVIASADLIFSDPKASVSVKNVSLKQVVIPRKKSSVAMGKKLSYSFNIFDGTHASGAFAQYIFEGDDDDIAEDQKETEQWEAVQGHI